MLFPGRKLRCFFLLALVLSGSVGLAQDLLTPPQPPPRAPNADANAEAVARILGISDLLGQLDSLRTQAGCGSPVTVEALAVRQEIVESVVGSSLDVDSVLAEIENERAQLFEVRAALMTRRDRSLGLL